jgi:hypothetical protein
MLATIAVSVKLATIAALSIRLDPSAVIATTARMIAAIVVTAMDAAKQKQ